MRQRDAEVVAIVLGTELRTCTDSEREGLLAAIAAIDGHMIHVHPEYDPNAFIAAVNDAAGTTSGVAQPPDLSERTYMVGLPVYITVTDEGVVTYEVETSAAGSAVMDERTTYERLKFRTVETVDQHRADVGAIEADHTRRQDQRE